MGAVTFDNLVNNKQIHIMKTITIIRDKKDPNKVGTVTVDDGTKKVPIGHSKDSGLKTGNYKLKFVFDEVRQRHLWTVTSATGRGTKFLPKVEYDENDKCVALFAFPYLKNEVFSVPLSAVDNLVQLNSVLRKETEANLNVEDITIKEVKEVKEAKVAVKKAPKIARERPTPKPPVKQEVKTKTVKKTSKKGNAKA